MKIQLLSDLHLEERKKVPKVWPVADVLVLAGDIGYPTSGIYRQFLRECDEKFKQVFLVAGNHEHYGMTVQEVRSAIDSFCATLKRTNFLDNRSVVYDGVKFVGTTLWSRVEPHQATINDFKYITDMTVPRYNALHDRSVAFLDQEIGSVEETSVGKQDQEREPERTDGKMPVIVVTHHLPSMKLIDPKYERYGDTNRCFASDCDRLFRPNVKAWFYGHTHTKSDRTIDGVRLVCNPIGYLSESAGKTRFDYQFIVDVTPHESPHESLRSDIGTESFETAS